MSVQKAPSTESVKDPLDHLLFEDALRNPVQESPWFAARTAALASSLPQRNERFFASFPLRWLLPIPLAGFAALTLMLLPHGAGTTTASASSESDFEDHIEMMTSSGNSTQDYLVSL